MIRPTKLLHTLLLHFKHDVSQDALLLQARRLRSRLQPCHWLLLTYPASAT